MGTLFTCVQEELLTSLASKDGALEEERRIKEVMQKEMEEVQTASQQRGSQLAMELQVTLDKVRIGVSVVSCFSSHDEGTEKL